MRIIHVIRMEVPVAMVRPELGPEDFEHMRSFIGQPLHAEQYNTEATSDTIRHYALGIGDDNPLWLDGSYARATRFGCRIAPPTFVYSVFDCGVVRGLPEGILPMHITAEIAFHEPIRIGDAILAETQIVAVNERKSARAGLIATQLIETAYRNQDGVRVAVVRQTLA